MFLTPRLQNLYTLGDQEKERRVSNKRTGNSDDHHEPYPCLVAEHLPGLHHEDYRVQGGGGDGRAHNRSVGIPIRHRARVAREASLEERHCELRSRVSYAVRIFPARPAVYKVVSSNL